LAREADDKNDGFAGQVPFRWRSRSS